MQNCLWLNRFAGIVSAPLSTLYSLLSSVLSFLFSHITQMRACILVWFHFIRDATTKHSRLWLLCGFIYWLFLLLLPRFCLCCCVFNLMFIKFGYALPTHTHIHTKERRVAHSTNSQREIKWEMGAQKYAMLNFHCQLLECLLAV